MQRRSRQGRALSEPADHTVRGIGALSVLLAVVLGVPVVLSLVGADLLPSRSVSWDSIQSALTHPDYGGSVILGAVTVGTWLAWLVFTVAVVVEIRAQRRHRHVRGIPGVQRLVAPLVAAALSVLTVGAPAPAGAVGLPSLSASATISPSVSAVPAASGTVAQETSAEPDDQLSRPLYTVRVGDSLWRIAAAHLGDGQRFHEIADLNYGRPQPDGGTLDATHWIHPGWQLALPGGNTLAEPEPHSPDRAGPVIRVVQPGESLSTIAREIWGDPNRYGEIVAASQGIVQPDGSTLVDPDHIKPGWMVHVPPSPPQAPDEETAPAIVAPGPGIDATQPAARPQDPQPIPSTGAAPSPRAPQSAAPAAGDRRVIDLRTASGIGGMLAAGLVGLVATRRVHARRSRAPGQRLVLPGEPHAVAWESRLRAVADPWDRHVTDKALRFLAAELIARGQPMPPLRVVRLLPHQCIEMYVDGARDLPEPWQPGPNRSVWRLDIADVPPGGDIGDVAAPFPSLVTIGQDAHAHVLLDLERTGCLDVRGSVEDGHAVLAALAIELATSPWADDLQVSVVGALGELPGILDTGRIRHLRSLEDAMRELEVRAVDVDQALRQVGAATIADARATGLRPDAWTPEILLVAEHLGPATRDALGRLVARVPGVGLAAVTTGEDASRWALHISPDDPQEAVLHPAGLRVRPGRLDPADYVQALALLANVRHVDGPAWAQALADRREPQLIDIPVSVSVCSGPVEPASVILADPVAPGPLAPVALDDTMDRTVPRAVAPLPEAPTIGSPTVGIDPLGIGPLDLGPLEPFDWSEYLAGRDFAVVEQSDGGESATVHVLRAPRVRVLGPVEVEVASGLVMPAGHRRQATELLAYLAFHPGSSGAQISASLWPTREPNLATRRSAVSRARRWLGVDASGREYLPRYWVRDDGTPADQEDAGYRLRGVRTDWDEFVGLVGDDIASSPTDRLRAALALVRGPAFAGVPARKYVWAESLWQEISASVVDVAHEVARRLLLAGDIGAVRHASRVGRLVDPADERCWRDGIRAEWAAGQRQAVTRLIAQLREQVAALDVEVEPATEELIAQVKERERPTVPEAQRRA